MAQFETNHTSYGTASFVNRAVVYVFDLISSVVAWNDSRVTRNALSALTDRELEDIGLSRGEIDRVADCTLIR